jgi:GNAT superfamily N-acetyltransferase
VYNVRIPKKPEPRAVPISPAGTTPALIREADASDLPRLLELYHQLAELSTLREDEVLPVTEAHHQALAAIQADPRMTCLVLEIHGRVMGTVTLYLLPGLSHGGRPFAIVENVVVDASLRGGGHGRALMTHAEELARTHGCYKVSLTSNNKRQEAHEFYKHIGYSASHQGFTKYSNEQRATSSTILTRCSLLVARCSPGGRYGCVLGV